ncbi:MAG: hypothetical protein II124_01070 [Clostridia bacterium]|nr:hypothetical protein [Clostridia bacterium]MBQ2518140.1 hypothetical protein [Clostridia bacterium]MBQ4341277.1 hypothetical protein [Clostridia bacterium]MBR6428752.1 hypothetical protein [Clostridia bacterium]
MQQNNDKPWFMDGSGDPSIDTKDLGTVQDEMYAEALAYKKCKVYESRFGDPHLAAMAADHAEHHRQHFDALRGYLESRN